MQGRDIAIGQVHHVDEACLLGGCCHFIGELEIFRERLFAQHMLVGGEQLHCRRVMDGIRRDVGGGIELAPGDGLVEVFEGILDAESLAKFGSAARHHINRAHEFAARIFAESRGMGLGHATRAENENAEFLGHDKFQFLNGREGTSSVASRQLLQRRSANFIMAPLPRRGRVRSL